MKKLAILFGGALVLAACQTTPPPPPPPPAPVDLNNPLMAPDSWRRPASGDQFEIQSSQLALQASQNVAVRNFANLHHRRSHAYEPRWPVSARSRLAWLRRPRFFRRSRGCSISFARGSGPSFDISVQAGADRRAQQALGSIRIMRRAATFRRYVQQQEAFPTSRCTCNRSVPPAPRRHRRHPLLRRQHRSGERG